MIQNPIVNFIFFIDRIIVMPTPYEAFKKCVTLAPDIPSPPLDGLGITVALSSLKCVYDTKDSYQDWLLNFNSSESLATAPGTANFKL